eukprot:2548896-Prymnesium_polylepis.1
MSRPARRGPGGRECECTDGKAHRVRMSECSVSSLLCSCVFAPDASVNCDGCGSVCCVLLSCRCAGGRE